MSKHYQARRPRSSAGENLRNRHQATRPCCFAGPFLIVVVVIVVVIVVIVIVVIVIVVIVIDVVIVIVIVIIANVIVIMAVVIIVIFFVAVTVITAIIVSVVMRIVAIVFIAESPLLPFLPHRRTAPARALLLWSMPLLSGRVLLWSSPQQAWSGSSSSQHPVLLSAAAAADRRATRMPQGIVVLQAPDLGPMDRSLRNRVIFPTEGPSTGKPTSRVAPTTPRSSARASGNLSAAS